MMLNSVYLYWIIGGAWQSWSTCRGAKHWQVRRIRRLCFILCWSVVFQMQMKEITRSLCLQHTHTYLTWSCDLLWISHERLRNETEITGLTVPLNQFSMAKLALDQGKWKHASSLLLILMAPSNGSQRDLTLVPTPQWRRVPKPPHTAIYIIFLQHV